MTVLKATFFQLFGQSKLSEVNLPVLSAGYLLLWIFFSNTTTLFSSKERQTSTDRSIRIEMIFVTDVEIGNFCEIFLLIYANI